MSAKAFHTHAFDAMGSTVELVLVGGTRRSASVAFATAEVWEKESELLRNKYSVLRFGLRFEDEPILVVRVCGISDAVSCFAGDEVPFDANAARENEHET